MKTTTLALFLVLFLSARSQTIGTLNVTVTTAAAGGVYAPKNIVSIWIEDSTGQFVKTLLAYAASRKTHLNLWEASTTAAGSPFNITDAISGSTRNNHATYNCTWDGTNFNGIQAPDGVYKVRMELTDKNATGNYASFNITKGPILETQSPGNVPSFSSIQLVWVPSITNLTKPLAKETLRVTPNPSQGIFYIGEENIMEVKVFSITGNFVSQTQSPVVNLSSLPDGLYLMQVSTPHGIVHGRIVKR